MPGANYDMSNGRALGYQIAYGLNQARALSTQQQLVISNRGGQPIMCTGLQPGSNPARWGLGILRQNFRGVAAFFGEQENPTVPTTTGSVALTFYAADGKTALIRVNETGLTGYAADGTTKLMALTDSAMTFYTATGKPVVKLSETGLYLTNATGTVLAELTDAGLQVRNPAGAMQLVAGRAIQTVSTQLTYSSTSWGPLTGGPSVSVEVGPSGQVDVGLGAVIQPGAHSGGESAYLAVSLTGGTTNYQPEILAEAGGTSLQWFTCFQENTITGLTPGRTYSFGVLALVTTTGVAAKYTRTTIRVQPV